MEIAREEKNKILMWKEKLWRMMATFIFIVLHWSKILQSCGSYHYLEWDFQESKLSTYTLKKILPV